MIPRSFHIKPLMLTPFPTVCSGHLAPWCQAAVSSPDKGGLDQHLPRSVLHRNSLGSTVFSITLAICPHLSYSDLRWWEPDIQLPPRYLPNKARPFLFRKALWETWKKITYKQIQFHLSLWKSYFECHGLAFPARNTDLSKFSLSKTIQMGASNFSHW